MAPSVLHSCQATPVLTDDPKQQIPGKMLGSWSAELVLPISAIARGRRWLDEIMTGSITDAEQLAKRERCTVRRITLTLSLAFLAPQLVKAAVEGSLPHGINIERLRDPDPNWTRQFQELGLDPH